MASVNTARAAVATFEGGRGTLESDLKTLRRLVSTCLLWEETFYATGSTIAQQMQALVKKLPAKDVAALAVEARTQMSLRHVPLFLVRELARVKGNGSLVAKTLETVIQRPDEITEYLAIYWQDQKEAPISAGSKRGLARAFTKFSEYQLAKYREEGKGVSLVGALRMVRPVPKDAEQSRVFKALRKGELKSFETWETELSAGKDKKETFERLLQEKKLGGLATLRNLRNMQQAGVSEHLIRARLADPMPYVWPYRFITAAKYAPTLEDALEGAMINAMKEIDLLPGITGLVIDVSGSMEDAMSLGKGDSTTRLDAACGLAILLREKAEGLKVATFSGGAVTIAPRRGFALREAIDQSQAHGGTCLKASLLQLRAKPDWASVDRLIVITDEQSADGILSPWVEKAYVINVAPYRIGVGADQGWTKINGWSERVFDFIQREEAG